MSRRRTVRARRPATRPIAAPTASSAATSGITTPLDGPPGATALPVAREASSSARLLARGSSDPDLPEPEPPEPFDPPEPEPAPDPSSSPSPLDTPGTWDEEPKLFSERIDVSLLQSTLAVLVNQARPGEGQLVHGPGRAVGFGVARCGVRLSGGPGRS